jgi:Sec-independent protein translocase protein TatA
MLAEIFGVDGIIVLVVVLVVLFGGAAIPKFARNLGSAKTEFEKGLKESKATDTAAGAPPAGGPSVPAGDETGPAASR